MIADRWGATDADVARRFGCDDLVRSPTLVAWRGVTVDAPAAQVWQWVTQIRLAPYSYDWIDNLGRRSPRELRDLPEPVVGEPFTRCGGRPLGRVLAVDPGRELTGVIMGARMSYQLVPRGDSSTRLLLKIAMAGAGWLAPLVSVGDLVMSRRQLQNFARLAERHPSKPLDHSV